MVFAAGNADTRVAKRLRIDMVGTRRDAGGSGTQRVAADLAHRGLVFGFHGLEFPLGFSAASREDAAVGDKPGKEYLRQRL